MGIIRHCISVREILRYIAEYCVNSLEIKNPSKQHLHVLYVSNGRCRYPPYAPSDPPKQNSSSKSTAVIVIIVIIVLGAIAAAVAVGIIYGGE